MSGPWLSPPSRRSSKRRIAGAISAALLVCSPSSSVLALKLLGG
jgi:hypothetical protein